MLAAPAKNWHEAAEKAAISSISLLIAAVLADFSRLSEES